MKKKILPIALGCLLLTPVVQAAPWLGTGDIFLRDDIQQLADAGIVTVPVTTYPLMWAGIGQDIEMIELHDVPERLQTPYLRVRHYYQKARNNDGGKHYKARLATDSRRFQGFGGDIDGTGKAESGVEMITDRFALKLNTQYSSADDDSAYQHQQKLTADGSYAAMVVENWVLRAGAVDQWWGPGWDNSLILSDNARPLPALSISRNDSHAFETPWLNWIGPWAFTMQMAQLESSRTVPRAKLWGSRLTLRPVSQLEVGVSWTIMWGGEGQPDSLSDFFNAVTGDTRCVHGGTDCDPADLTKLGNQMAGYDFRWADEVLGWPLAVYGQTIGEDVINTIKPTDKAYLFGAETRVQYEQQSILLFAEYTDTQVDCDNAGIREKNCYYEHLVYQSGHRYKGRALGASIDNDSVSWTLGAISQQANNHSWQAKLRWIEINSDNTDRYQGVPELGHTLTDLAEDVVQVDVSYRFPWKKGMLTLGGDISRSTMVETDKTSNDVNLFASWEYRY